MYKLMIADDNPYILEELSQSIDWEDYDFELIGTYNNGVELLTAAEETIPDLVITDISMPMMDGIHLSSCLYEINPFVKIIFISNYTEFEYAKIALNLHIYDYLLKPIQQSQLLDVMERVSNQLQEEQHQFFLKSQNVFYRKTALSHYTSRLLYHTDNDALIKEEFLRLGVALPETFNLYIVCCSLNHILDNPNQLRSLDLFQCIFEIDQPESQIIPFKTNASHEAFLLILHNDAISIHNLLSRICIDIDSKIKSSVTMGYSNSSTIFSTLPQLYDQATTALKYLTDVKATIPFVSYADIHDVFPILSDEDNNVTTNHSNLIKSVNEMRSFIHENYMESITTMDVARTVYLSPGYANICFRNHFGTTIFSYIEWYRIERAKYFLSETDEQVTRIAEMVGYSGKTAFYLAFKRKTGISPTEYRLNYLTNLE